MTRQAHIACSEVWGGNHATEAALVLPGISGWVLARPFHGAQAGGDVHYISSCGTGRITRLLLADVAGHGQDVADIGSRLRAAMQRYLNHIAPHQLAQRLNRDVAALTDGSGRFATAIVLTYFAPDGTLSVCNAGHPAPLIYRAATETWSTLDQPDTAQDIANLPLGVLEDSGYVGRELPLHPGDQVLCYTDCLSEAIDDQGRLLGPEGLIDILNTPNTDPNTPTASSQIIPSLLSTIESRGYRTDDDLTAVLLQCTGHSGGVRPLRRVLGIIRSMTAPLAGRPLPLPEMSWLNLAGISPPRKPPRKFPPAQPTPEVMPRK